jgi:hypothetical protein
MGSTGVSNLRKHLFTYHLDDWVAECKELGIRITTEPAVQAMKGLGFGVVEEDSEQPQYSQEAFLDSLVELIVGEDLVSYAIIKLR